MVVCVWKDFPGGSDCKASAYNAGDPGTIPGTGRPPGEGSGNPLRHSCLENPMDGGTWWAMFGGFLGDSVVKNPPANAGEARHSGSIPGSGRSPGEGKDNSSRILAQKFHDGAWWAEVCGVAKSQRD